MSVVGQVFSFMAVCAQASEGEKEEPSTKTVEITGAVEMKGIVGSDGRCVCAALVVLYY